MGTRLLQYGEPAFYFKGKTLVNNEFNFDTVAGRFIVLCFFGSASNQIVQKILEGFYKYQGIFNEQHACFFGVSIDPEDKSANRIESQLPGFHIFWDFDRSISHLYGALQELPTTSEYDIAYQAHSLVLDQRLRVISCIPFSQDADQHVQTVLDVIRQQKTPVSIQPTPLSNGLAPVLVVPRIFEPQLCQTLMQYYQTQGGSESGFMREVNGKTVGINDSNRKRRSDCEITHEVLKDACMHRIHDRLAPEIQKAFQFKSTRIERYIVACYDSTTGGYFKSHRDNTTKGTAHRKFAVSLNLNTGEYTGGCLRFPEFGLQEYSAPAGGAVVFSCSLLHEATPITSGVRYAFLPFLYDDQAAQIRQKNKHHIA